MRPVIYKMLAMAMCFSILLVGCQQPVELPNPDAAGSITDIRMTVSPEHQTDDITYLRMHYGYYADGKWHDFPYEHYKLKAIFVKSTDNQATNSMEGYTAAVHSHIVKIGPFLVVNICDSFFSEDPESVRVVDSLGNTATQMFSEYCYGAPYGHIVKKPRPGDNGPEQITVNKFSTTYFLTLEYDTLPEDYVLSYLTIDNDKLITQTLTYAEIKQLIEG